MCALVSGDVRLCRWLTGGPVVQQSEADEDAGSILAREKAEKVGSVLGQAFTAACRQGLGWS